MAEEKKSDLLQIRIPVELKESMENKAKEIGVSLNQYIMFIFIEKMEKS